MKRLKLGVKDNQSKSFQVPIELANLYRHWGKHTDVKIEFQKDPNYSIDLLNKIERFITDRMLIWEKKQEGQNPPYTTDPILRRYRFCNIYRELDNQTITIHTNLSNIRDNFYLWLLNLAFHRFICNPETVEKIGRLSFDNKHNEKVYSRLRELPSPKYGTAYVFPVSVIQRSEYDTREKFFCNYLPLVINQIAQTIQSFENITVLSALDRILPQFGYNFRFHWTEILIDIAYQFPDKIDLFRDFYAGPGAIPTLQNISKDNDILNNLVTIKLNKFSYLTYQGKPVYLSAENWEGIACEFRKYTNLQKGNGRKRLYK